MKKLMIIAALLILSVTSRAQIPGVSLVTGVVKKVIVALDIKVQQLQNQTLALQNAAKSVENTLSLNKLNDINGWLTKEKDLYRQYYAELAKVRSVINNYQTVKRIISQQARLVAEYKSAWVLLRSNGHFNPSELGYMAGVYEGILSESVRNLDELLSITTSLSTQMRDGERLEAVRRVSVSIQTNLNNLRQFTQGNTKLSLLRARDAEDRQAIKKLYGL